MNKNISLKKNCFTIVLGLQLFVFILGFVACVKKNPLTPEGDPMVYENEVQNFRAIYDTTSNTVILSWEPIQGDIDFYRIYRAPAGPDGLPDIEKLTSTEKRRFIDKNQKVFFDVLELANKVYFYGIQAGKIIPRNNAYFDTVVGKLTDPLVSVQVGSDISFYINNGDLFTVTRNCSLTVNDYRKRIRKVRFTQQAHYYLRNTTTGAMELADDFYTPSSPLSVERFLELSDTTKPEKYFITAAGKLAPGVEIEIIPDFDALDAENNQAFIFDTSLMRNSFPWVLKSGNGEKRVFAEVTLSDGKRDTLMDAIKIQPYRIRINLRNDFETSDRTMRRGRGEDKRVGGSYIPWYYIYKPKLEFSVSIFSDTTIEEQFYFWVVLQSNGTAFAFDPLDFQDRAKRIDPLYPWLETTPAKFNLTGTGASHDDNYVYRYALDTIEGKSHFDNIRMTFRDPQHKGRGLAFQLQSNEIFNDIAIAGSYWGTEPVQFNEKADIARVKAGTDTLFLKGQTFFNGTLSEKYKKLFSLGRAELHRDGIKEVLFMGLFRGRFFGDTRIVIAQYNENGTYLFRSFFDLFQPTINLFVNDATNSNPAWLTNDSTITSTFSYALRYSGSVSDKGYANISAVKLIIAKKPDWMPWILHTSPDSIATPDTLSVSLLYTLRHRVFPFEIKTKMSYLSGVRWDNIDISNWPSGQYIMGIVTKDEYGNEGWGLGELRNARYTNPWLVNIVSGK